MTCFVAMRAGNVFATSSSSSLSFSFWIGACGCTRFPWGSFGGKTIPFSSPFAFTFGISFSFSGGREGWLRCCLEVTKFLALFGGVVGFRMQHTNVVSGALTHFDGILSEFLFVLNLGREKMGILLIACMIE